mmetsp:Transcript_15282/g.32558  ORF Transcript_15282/g.32558 Transcript_15282/m.32558 type:complete len:274 (-) Transcript_15282:194-1015(-)
MAFSRSFSACTVRTSGLSVTLSSTVCSSAVSFARSFSSLAFSAASAAATRADSAAAASCAAFCRATLSSATSAASTAAFTSASNRTTSSSCELSCCTTPSSIARTARSFASRCAMSEAASEERSVVALTFARTSTFMACCPNSSELTVSNLSVMVGATQTMRVVRAAPPMAWESSRVSFDSRKGGRSFFFEARISMHLPSVVSDWLMAFASSNAAPSTPLFLTRSDPARSTKCSLPERRRPAPEQEICTMSTACDLDESAFIFVAAVFRFSLP